VSAVRRAIWLAGAPLRLFLIGLVRLYRVTLSGWLGGQCRFVPSCSQYAEEAVRHYGAIRGSAMAAWRILRCNPFGPGGLDPVRRREEYEAVTQLPDRAEVSG
jgi:uncharacterized protein